jgi:hypothetical protein
MSKRIKISNFAQDEKNFNKHTEKGMALLKKSIETVGVIESVTVSADDKIISGNARHEKIGEVLGDVEPIVVETDGTRPVVLKRTDIRSNTRQFHEAALLANTTAKHNINLDESLIKEIAVDTFNINIEEVDVEDVAFEIVEDEKLLSKSNNRGSFLTDGIKFTFGNCSRFIKNNDVIFADCKYFEQRLLTLSTDELTELICKIVSIS